MQLRAVPDDSKNESISTCTSSSFLTRLTFRLQVAFQILRNRRLNCTALHVVSKFHFSDLGVFLVVSHNTFFSCFQSRTKILHLDSATFESGQFYSSQVLPKRIPRCPKPRPCSTQFCRFGRKIPTQANTFFFSSKAALFFRRGPLVARLFQKSAHQDLRARTAQNVALCFPSSVPNFDFFSLWGLSR